MPIIKQAESPTGTSLVYHEIHKLETTPDFSSVLIYVRGYAHEPKSQQPLIVAWMWQFALPATAVTSLLPADLETLVVTSPQSPLFGGEILQAETPLETAKRNKWAEIKHAREMFEFGEFTWNGKVFDADPLSQQRISQATQQAMLSKSLGIPYTQDWTLRDNSVVQLNADEMIEVALALGQHTNIAHNKSRSLRTVLDLTTTPQEVATISWDNMTVTSQETEALNSSDMVAVLPDTESVNLSNSEELNGTPTNNP
jgi:hypothetical protein